MSTPISSLYVYSHLFISCLNSSLYCMSTLISSLYVYSHLFLVCLLSSHHFMSTLISSFHVWTHIYIVCLLSSLHCMSTLISSLYVYCHLFILCLNSSFYFSITKLHHCTLSHICSTCFIHYFTIFPCFIWIVQNYRHNLIFFISFLSSCYLYTVVFSYKYLFLSFCRKVNIETHPCLNINKKYR